MQRRKEEVSSYSRVADTRLALGGTDVGVVHLCGELQARQGLRKVRLQWANHHEHERFGVTTEGELEEVSQLETS